MMMRLKLWKRRRIQTLLGIGTLTCSKCETANQYMLFEGDVCKNCYVPGKIIIPTEIVRQKPMFVLTESLEWMDRCEVARAELEMNQSEFCRILRTSKSSYSAWLRHQLKEDGQLKMLARVKAKFPEIKKMVNTRAVA